MLQAAMAQSTAKSETRIENIEEIALLPMAVVDQLPHLRKQQPAAVETVQNWFLRFIKLAELGSESESEPKFSDYLKATVPENGPEAVDSSKDHSEILKTESPEHQKWVAWISQPSNEVSVNGEPDQLDQADFDADDEADLFPAHSAEDEQHKALSKWAREDVLDAVRDGIIGELVMYLTSPHQEIRIQALGSLRQFMSSLEASTYEGRLQAKILIGELTETADTIIKERQLPTFAAALSVRLLAVIDDPRHFLYAKANAFLMRRPRWQVSRLPSYWIGEILSKLPTEDGCKPLEENWLLELLISGVRNSDDVESYHRSDVFQTAMHLWNRPSILQSACGLGLDLFYTCANAQGSTLLITKHGILTWLEAIMTQEQSESPMITKKLRVLERHLKQTCDREETLKWSDGLLDVSKLNV